MAQGPKEISTQNAQSLVEILQQRAKRQPDDLVFRFLHSGDAKGPITEWSFAQLDKRVRIIGNYLQKQQLRDKPVLLLYPADLEFIAGFFACLYSNIIAVPVAAPHPVQMSKMMPRLVSIIRDAGANVVLTTQKVVEYATLFTANHKELKSLQWVATDKLTQEPDGWDIPPPDPHATAFIQYTSGSTGDPKGVMLSHHNLLQDQRMLKMGSERSSDTKIVCWLPLFHDLGLVANVLHTVFLGAQCTLMSPLSFLQKPARWLQAISYYRADLSSAPNFAYELSSRKISKEDCQGLDLSCWQVAGNGAEPVRFTTLRKFAEKFAPQGFLYTALNPVYGLAESTVACSGKPKIQDEPTIQWLSEEALRNNEVTFTKPGTDGSRALVSAGRFDWLGQEIIVVDPDSHKMLEDRCVGELWLKSDIVGKGYWKRPELSREIFENEPIDGPTGPFLKSGDLGFIHEEQLYITGRLKDLIIVRGKNHYPQDIELTVENAHQDIRNGCVAAFCLDSDEEERLVIVAEVKERPQPTQAEEIREEILRAVAGSHELKPHDIALIEPRSISKTSSGKIQRQKTRQAYASNKLKIANSKSKLKKFKEDTQSKMHIALSTSPAFLQLRYRATKLLQNIRSVRDSMKDREDKRVEEANILDTETAKSHNESEDFSASKTSQIIATIPTPSPKGQEVDVTESLIATMLAEHLGISVDDIDTTATFDTFGLDSKSLVALSGDLATVLQKEFPPTILYDYPTILALAKFIADPPRSESKKGHPRPRTSASNNYEPMAIIGAACRMPGGANTLESFWENLINSKDCISEVPSSRWDWREFYNANGIIPGKMSTKWGAFIDDPSLFDARFFSISPREAPRIDPQQRLALEVTWEALENAGIAPKSLEGSQTGVFLGISHSDYGRMQSNDRLNFGIHASTGNTLSIAANRISYAFDLRGPSMAVDTACSSSLVALHHACRSIQLGDSQLAIAGGVNLILSPDLTIAFSQARMMAPDGRCKSFDDSADGYVRGEGCGAIVIKSLTEALEDGDPIMAIIRGSAVNQDGRSNGITAPNGPAQEAVIHAALDAANLSSNDIDYIEAHGTGTSLGDPIECLALGNVFAREKDAPCIYLGSAKTNIGHLEAAAGVAGLLKVILSMEHKKIPAHLHFQKPSEKIPWKNLPFRIPTEPIPWPTRDHEKLAGISSFGFGGTNSHVIIQSPPPQEEVELAMARPRHILTLSAKSHEALQKGADRFATYFEAPSHPNIENICHTSNAHRDHFEHRMAVTGSSFEEIHRSLRGYLEGQEVPQVATSRIRKHRKNKIAFLFSGQGSQYVGMGRELFNRQPLFRMAMEQCDIILQQHLGTSIIDKIYGENATEEKLSRTLYTQPAIFSLEYSLAILWSTWGIVPDIVMGHSIGEITAACVAGVMTLNDALKLVACRAKALDNLPEGGTMMVLYGQKGEIDDLISPYPESVGLAGHNSANEFVISGRQKDIDDIGIKAKAKGLSLTTLKVSQAFHSPLVESSLDEFATAIQEIPMRSPRIDIISNITGSMVTSDMATPSYWRHHVRKPVLFSKGLETIRSYGADVFVECGPHTTLLGLGRRSVPAGIGQWLPSLKRKRDDWEQILETVATLYSIGAPINWDGFDAGYIRRRVRIPNYPFQREHYWIEEATQVTRTIRKKIDEIRDEEMHPLRGHQIEVSNLQEGESLFELNLSTDLPVFSLSSLGEDVSYLSRPAFIGIALEAVKQLKPNDSWNLMHYEAPHRISTKRGGSIQCQVLLQKHGEDYQFKVSTSIPKYDGGRSNWNQSATGKLILQRNEEPTKNQSLVSLQEKIEVFETPANYYERCSELGLGYTKSQNEFISKIFRAENQILTQVKIPSMAGDRVRTFQTSPELHDACKQTYGALCPLDGKGTYEPVAFERMVSTDLASTILWIHGQLHPNRKTDTNFLTMDLCIYTENGELVSQIQKLKLVPAPKEKTLGEQLLIANEEEQLFTIKTFIHNQLAKGLKIPSDKLDPNVSLTELGLDSLVALEVVNSTEKQLGIKINITKLVEGTTIATLAEYAMELFAGDEQTGETTSNAEPEEPDDPVLVPFSKLAQDQPPIFFVHPVGGSALCYVDLARALEDKHAFIGIHQPLLVDIEQNVDSIESIAADYVSRIQEKQPQGPYRLAGWSMGGVIAFEMAKQLTDLGKTVSFLGIIDGKAPSAKNHSLPHDKTEFLLRILAQDMGIPYERLDLELLRTTELDEGLRCILRLAKDANIVPWNYRIKDFRKLFEIFEQNLRTLNSYSPDPFDGRVHVYRSEIPLPEHKEAPEDMGWGPLCHSVACSHVISGTHFTLIRKPNVETLAKHLNEALK